MSRARHEGQTPSPAGPGPAVDSMRLETPVIDTSASEPLTDETLKITCSDDDDLEEAIAAIERLERSMRGAS